MWNCTHFRHPTDEQLRHVDIDFLATKMICSLSTLNMYKDTSYLGSKLPQVTFSKRNKHCSFRLMEQNKTKHPLALSRVEPRVTKFDKVTMF